MATTLEQQVPTIPTADEMAVSRKRVPRMRKPLDLKRLLALLLLGGMSVLFIAPFLWMFSTSLKGFDDLAGANWFPKRLAWENYSTAFSENYGMWPQWAMNSIIITV